MDGSGGVASSEDSLQSERSGFGVLAEQLDAETVKDIIDFWIDDYTFIIDED